MRPEVDAITLYILKELSEFESVKEVGSVKFVTPRGPKSEAGICIVYPDTLWQDIDYRLKLMKYYGLLQYDETPDPDIGVAYICISALGRRMMLEDIEKRINVGRVKKMALSESQKKHGRKHLLFLKQLNPGIFSGTNKRKR